MSVHILFVMAVPKYRGVFAFIYLTISLLDYVFLTRKFE